MGSTLSNTIAEIFLQHLEHTHTHLKHLLDTKAINYYTRYVDDILIIYNTDHNSPGNICHQLNTIYLNLTFTPKYEENNTISFLDLLITRHNNTLDINIYRKPTTTVTTINYISNHPKELKMAAYRYLIHRMQTLPLTQTNRAVEWRTIQNIAHNNNFPMQLITHLRTNMQQKPNRTTSENRNTWATFTFHSPIIRR